MTLIAGFRSKGLPILLGDFLITTAGKPDGLKKKLRRVRSNVVLAWTGHSIAAEFVVRELDSQLPPGRITYQRLRRVLTSLDLSPVGTFQVVLIGWIADEGEHCFRWRSDYPGAVFDVETAFEGSGGHLIEAIVGRRDHAGVPRDPVTVEGALLDALNVAARLMSYETGDPPNAAGRTFGHAYELLYLQGESFVYLDKVLYASAFLEFNADDSLVASKVLDPVLRYRARDEVAVVDRQHERERRLYLTTAVGDPRGLRKARALETEYRAELRLRRFGLSRYHCLFVQLFSGSYIALPGAWTQGPSTPDTAKWILEDAAGGLTVRFPAQVVTEFYRFLKHYEETGELVDPWQTGSSPSS